VPEDVRWMPHAPDPSCAYLRHFFCSVYFRYHFHMLGYEPRKEFKDDTPMAPSERSKHRQWNDSASQASQAARREHVPLQIHLDDIAVHLNESNEIRKVLEYYVLDTPKHKEVGDFILDFTVKTTGVTEDGNQKIGKARLHLFYFPCREGHETTA
jgi:hypothetical protein